MDITVTINSSDPAELARLFSAIANTEAAAPASPQATAAEEPKPTRRRRTKAEIEADAANAAGTDADGQPNPPAAATPAAPAAEAPSAQLDYNRDVRPKILDASQSKEVGLDAVVALLGTFGVKRGQDIPVDKLPDFLAKLADLYSRSADPVEDNIL